jgi:hypothetical protein
MMYSDEGRAAWEADRSKASPSPATRVLVSRDTPRIRTITAMTAPPWERTADRHRMVYFVIQS